MPIGSHTYQRAETRNEDFHHDSKFLGVLLLGVLSYLLSFRVIIKMLISLNWDFTLGWNMLITGITFCLAILSVIYGYRFTKSKNKVVAYRIMIIAALILLAVTGFSFLYGLIISIILSNLTVILLGAFLFWSGLNELDRRYFWLGLGLLVLEIGSRFFEYDTGLLLKSLAFVLAGLALIIGGVWFEKRYQKQVTDRE